MISKRKIMRLLFAGEVILFSWFYYYGMCGMREIDALRSESLARAEQIALAQEEIKNREEMLSAWHSDPFYKEKLAREQLHMAKDGEEIYLIQ